METNFLRKHKPLLIFGAILLIGALVFSNKKIDIKNSLTKQTSFPSHSVNLGKNVLNLQRLRIPSITTYSQDKILNFFIQNRTYYIALRSGDNNSSSLYAFDRKDNALLTQKNFGENGVMTFKTKMLLSITRGIDGEIYYIRHGVHALKNGNDVVSYKDKTTATKIALLPGEHQAYLYGKITSPWQILKIMPLKINMGDFWITEPPLFTVVSLWYKSIMMVQSMAEGALFPMVLTKLPVLPKPVNL